MLTDAIFRALVESLPDAVVIADRAGQIMLVNAQAEALFGYERAELTGQRVEVLVPDELRAAHHGHRSAYASRPGTRPMGVAMELQGRRKDGGCFPVEISLSPLVRGTELYVTSVIRDVSERNRMRSELEMQRERQRIAMDLHDGTIQTIYAIGLGLELVPSDIASDPVRAGKRVDGAIDQLNGVIGDIRAYIFDLRPVQFAGDLLVDLSATVEEFRASSTLRVSCELPPSIAALREDRATAMLHIAREGLTNARKHARASEVAVVLAQINSAVHVEIRDDGDGFEPQARLTETHRGLRNMRLRTQRLGGSFDVESAPGAGTTLRVRMPVGV
jgi:PAS domain S-box-containing protein